LINTYTEEKRMKTDFSLSSLTFMYFAIKNHENIRFRSESKYLRGIIYRLKTL